MKNKDLQPKQLYPARLTFKIEEIKSFPDKKKIKVFITTKSVLQEMLKGKLQEEKVKEYSWKNKMAINMYLSITTLNVNGLDAPIKRQRVAEWIRKQDPYNMKGDPKQTRIYL